MTADIAIHPAPAPGSVRLEPRTDRGARVLAEFHGRRLDRLDVASWLLPAVRLNLRHMGATLTALGNSPEGTPPAPVGPGGEFPHLIPKGRSYAAR